MPEYIKDKDNNYALWFYDQHMLVFTKPIIYKKINISTKILFNAISKPNEINDMNFLATKTNWVSHSVPVSKDEFESDDFF